MKRIVLLQAFAVTALCSACATGPSDTYCPALVPYPPAVQAQAAAEIEANTAPVLSRFAADYGELRAAVRGACR
jgi:hypothetical protein